MDHELALKTRSAEKYLIGDLRPRAREAFEQHFFECEECAEEVRMGFQFRENLKAVFREEPATVYQPAPPSRVRGWFAWMNLAAWGPKAAMAAVAALCVYQNAVQIPALKTRMGFLERPAVLSPTSLSALSRSAAPTVKVSSAAPFFQLSLAIGSVSSEAEYQCDLRSASGKFLASIPIGKLESETNLPLLIASSTLPDGYYDAVLVGTTGSTSAELDRYRFAVRRD